MSTVEDLPSEFVVAALAHVAAISAGLAARLAEASAASTPATTGDRLLDIREAAQRLGMSTSRLYREATHLPFTVRRGRSVRFSAVGIDRYIQRQVTA